MIVRRITLILLLLSCLLFPAQAFAHASLTKVVPEPDSQWDTAPTQINLSFNERLESQLFYIKVLNSLGESVTSQNALMSEQHKNLTLELPVLSDGVYTVSYKAVSADGHPINEAYVFIIGESKDLTKEGNSDPSNQDGILLFTSRCSYFLSLLFVVGWTFWRMVEHSTASRLLRKTQVLGSLILQACFLLSLTVMIGFQLPQLIDEWTGAKLLSILGTNVGLSWLSSLILSAVGFYSLHRNKIFDLVWIMLLLTAKSINGHSAAVEPQIGSFITNWVHLFAASLWAGGLLYLFVLWNKEKEFAVQFLPKFSKAAFISIIGLSVTGIISTLMFLPNLKYLMHTQWGILLLVKTSLVLLVIFVGLLIRRQMKRKQGYCGNLLLKLDFTLMVLIVIIVGVLTYLNPIPVNEPLSWYERGNELSMSASISPNSPGFNSFQVDVWVPDRQAPPKQVQLRLRYLDNPDMAPIEVPLINIGEIPNDKDGFYRIRYSDEGPYLPIPGSWEVEVRVRDYNDNEKVYVKQTQIY